MSAPTITEDVKQSLRQLRQQYREESDSNKKNRLSTKIKEMEEIYYPIPDYIKPNDQSSYKKTELTQLKKVADDSKSTMEERNAANNRITEIENEIRQSRKLYEGRGRRTKSRRNKRKRSTRRIRK
jgi:hypothetical protein